jgi:hypothetical protein
LIFILAHWHGLAKLRQHTDLSLNTLESVTKDLGQGLREFEGKVCSVFDTRELKREAEARQRQSRVVDTIPPLSSSVSSSSSIPSSSSNPQSAQNLQSADPPPSTTTTIHPPATSAKAGPHKSTSKSTVKGKTALERHIGRRRKAFNLNTYKNHSIDDYVRTIRMYGTTDSYSTEPVSAVYILLYRMLTLHS